jgi:hypothetical protein
MEVFMKLKDEMDFTDNSRLYRKLRKEYLASKGIISCSFCPYHENENRDKKRQKSWKKLRRKQYIER